MLTPPRLDLRRFSLVLRTSAEVSIVVSSGRLPSPDELCICCSLLLSSFAEGTVDTNSPCLFSLPLLLFYTEEDDIFLTSRPILPFESLLLKPDDEV